MSKSYVFLCIICILFVLFSLVYCFLHDVWVSVFFSVLFSFIIFVTNCTATSFGLDFYFVVCVRCVLYSFLVHINITETRTIDVFSSIFFLLYREAASLTHGKPRVLITVRGLSRVSIYSDFFSCSYFHYHFFLSFFIFI